MSHPHSHHHHHHHHRASHAHVYYSGSPVAMRRTAWATGVSFVMMVVEIVAGHLTGSMALLADGWHMATHVMALGLSWVAFVFSRRLAADPRFAFGTGKLEVLAGFVSALLLFCIGLWMGLESVARLLAPTEVNFVDAMVVAVIGLWVNLVCALLLHQKTGAPIHVGPAAEAGSSDGHRHGHDHSHSEPHAGDHGHAHAHDHSHSHGDGHGHAHVHADDHAQPAAHHAGHGTQHHQVSNGSANAENTVLKPASTENLNLKAAYLHVLADALTSILAIVALLFGQLTGLPQVDSFMGLVGALMVILWARGLVAESAWVLLDRQAPDNLQAEVRSTVARLCPTLTVQELKLWQVASGAYACNLSLAGLTFDQSRLRDALLASGRIVHLVVELKADS